MGSTVVLVLLVLAEIASSYQSNFWAWPEGQPIGYNLGARPYPPPPRDPLNAYICCNNPVTPPSPPRSSGLRSLIIALAKRESGQRFPILKQSRLADSRVEEPRRQAGRNVFLSSFLPLHILSGPDRYGKRGFVEASSGPGGGNTKFDYYDY